MCDWLRKSKGRKTREKEQASILGGTRAGSALGFLNNIWRGELPHGSRPRDCWGWRGLNIGGESRSHSVEGTINTFSLPLS